MDLQQQLDAARNELAACSYIENQIKWLGLFKNATSISTKLSNVESELAQLERKMILHSRNRFYFIVYL